MSVVPYLPGKIIFEDIKERVVEGRLKRKLIVNVREEMEMDFGENAAVLR